jgi:hypothetical protein
MNILFFSPYYIPYISGITTYPQAVLIHLAKNHQIQVLTFRHNRSLAKHEEIDSVKVTRLNFLFKISKGFISPQSIWYFLNHLSKTDIVIINLPSARRFALSSIFQVVRQKNCQYFSLPSRLRQGFN